MAHRTVLTARQRSALFDIPVDEGSLLKHYILADDDIEHIRKRRRPQNQMGFALQLCALRYPGRLLKAGEVIPEPVSVFLAAQLGLQAENLSPYASREKTRREHLVSLRKIYGYEMFSGKIAQKMRKWLGRRAEAAHSNEALVRSFVEECRLRRIILPGHTVVERNCADALVVAERRIEHKIVQKLNGPMREQLNGLLSEEVKGGISRFIWLRQFEVGRNSAEMNRLLDKLEFLRALELPADILNDIPPHRIARLRRQGERYFTDGLKDITSDRRIAILTACAVEWEAALADTVVETHDRIVGTIWRDAKRMCEAHVSDAKVELENTLSGFEKLGSVLLEARGDKDAIVEAIETACGWDTLEALVVNASVLKRTVKADTMTQIVTGYHRFIRYARRMATILNISGARVSQPLISAAIRLQSGEDVQSESMTFLRPRSRWHGLLRDTEINKDRLWVVAVMFHLRDAFRSGDIWLLQSRRYNDMRQVLVPAETANAMGLFMPLDPHAWLKDRKRRLEEGLNGLAVAVRKGALPSGLIENGQLRLNRLESNKPDEASELVLDLYRRLPETKITDILIDVDNEVGFTESFTHLRTGTPCPDKIGLLNIILSEGLNLGLRKMAGATHTHNYLQLSRLSRWHVERDSLNNALATIIEAQSKLPMAQLWGSGTTSSSDGQFFPTTRQGEAMNLINAKYGSVPGLKAYTHVSDQYAPFATQVIPATVSEAPYILDGLLMNAVGKRIKEHYADTGGFTDLVFAVTSLLGYLFLPRIRDLASKRLHVFDLRKVPKELKGLSGDKIRENTIINNWPDILRCVATIVSGKIQPSQMLKKLSARPRQHDLAIALREIGRVERTLFIIEWLLNTDMQRRVTIGLNKGEAHHALKNALRIGRQGEIRDRTAEGQHFRIAGLNLLTAIIVYWNTKQLGLAVRERQKVGLDCPPQLLAHISPLGWAHILLTGEYRWRTTES